MRVSHARWHCRRACAPGPDALPPAAGPAPAEAVAANAAEHRIVSVAMPLIAGPGAIITEMTMAARAADAGRPSPMLVAVAAVAAVVWLVLAGSGWVQQPIGAQLVLGGIADCFDLAVVTNRP